MKAAVFGLDGKKGKEISLPGVFETEVDNGLIKRAVLSMQSARLQPKGVKEKAGRLTTAAYRASRNLPMFERTMNVGRARLPRTKNRRHLLFGRVANVPQAVGGAAAHPPKPEKKLKEKINKRERKKALNSAIAATADVGLVSGRHSLPEKLELPVVVENKFAEIKKTSEVVKALEALKLAGDVESAKKKRKLRGGKGKKRGRKYKKKKSLLIVTAENAPVYKAARNLEGVDICSVKNLNAELLAPGCKPGRLTVWTEKAINALKEGS